MYAGFHTFMTAVKRPQSAQLVPAAATAVVQSWKLLETTVPAALDDVNITIIAALLARLTFIQALLTQANTLTTRLLALQSHLEDQLATQLRPLFDRCRTLFATHDLLSKPMAPLLLLFTFGGQKSAEARANNESVTERAQANAPQTTATTPPTSTNIPSVPETGTTPPPAAATPPAATPPVKTPPQPAPPAHKKTRSRG